MATSWWCGRRSRATPATSAAGSETVTVGTQTDTHMFWDEAQFRLRYMQRATAQLENDILARGLQIPGVKQTRASLVNTLLLDDISRIYARN